MNAPLAVVINPAAGGGRPGRYLRDVSAVLDASGRKYTMSESTSLEHARTMAAEAADRGETVVAFGGDGLTAALAGAVGTGSLGIIPAGNGNDFARTLKIPFHPPDAAQVLLDGTLRTVDLIEVARAGETQVAPVMVTGSVYIGIASVAGEIADRMRFVRGPLLYNLAALRALLGWKPTKFRIETTGVDGQRSTEEFTGYAVVVANSPYFGAGMMVAPHAHIGDGLLDVMVMRHAPKLVFLRALTKIKDGSHVALEQVGMTRAVAATVTVDRPLPVGADGEILTAGPPWHIRAIPGALKVVVPAHR